MKIRFVKDKPNPKVPPLLYALGQPVRFHSELWQRLASIESALLRSLINRNPVTRPIYITGLARSGTTITLELLSRHRNVASHRYLDMIQPYLPFVWNQISNLIPLADNTPRERPHRDGIWYTTKSPEAVEEFFWQKFFKHAHDENHSSILGSRHRNSRFDKWYSDQIAKLLISRGKRRYIAKANYNITRINYLLELFDDARFIVLVRHPVDHMVSYLKQNDLLTDLYTFDNKWWVIAKALGHFEFGQELKFINTQFGDIKQIRRLWDAGDRVTAFAHYWVTIYSYLLDTCERDPRMNQAIKIIRFEDLCAKPGETIDAMLNHVKLDPAAFFSVREEYLAKLQRPEYYKAEVTPRERETILSLTKTTAERLGYL